MGTAIRTRIVKIGNSQGIRIPKLLLEQSGLGAEVEVHVEGDHLIICPAPCQRLGWDEAFAAMAEHGDDTLIDDLHISHWDESEWDW